MKKLNNETIMDVAMFIADAANITSTVSITATVIAALVKDKRFLRISVPTTLTAIVIEKIASIISCKAMENIPDDDMLFDNFSSDDETLFDMTEEK